MNNSAIKWLLCFFPLFFLAGCDDDNDVPIVIPQTETFVLVHGAFQGAYVWQYVKDQLVKNGQKVVVVELPAHGGDNTAPAATSINVYRDKVISSITPAMGKVVLVGHSLGGMVISAVAEKIPDQIGKLVYLTAFVPANGQSLLDLASTDSTSLLGAALIPSKDQLTLDVKPENIAPIFVQDGSDIVKKVLLDNKKVEPAIPFGDKVALTAANFGKVKKYYIHTTKDMALGYNLQKRMVASGGIKNVYSLDTGHSPFLSKPDALTEILMKIIAAN